MNFVSTNEPKNKMAKIISIIAHFNLLITIPIHGWLGYQKIERLAFFFSLTLPPPTSIFLENIHMYNKELLYFMFLAVIIYTCYYLVDSCTVVHVYFKIFRQKCYERNYYLSMAKLQLGLSSFVFADGILVMIFGSVTKFDGFCHILICVWKMIFIIYIGHIHDPKTILKTKLCSPALPKVTFRKKNKNVVVNTNSVPRMTRSSKLVPSTGGSINILKNSSTSDPEPSLDTIDIHNLEKVVSSPKSFYVV